MHTLASSMHNMHTTLVVVRISRTQYAYRVWILSRVEKKPYELHHVP